MVTLKSGARRLLCICRGPKPDPSTYGKNKFLAQGNDSPEGTVDEQHDQDPAVLSGEKSSPGNAAHNMVYGAGAAVAAGAAALTGSNVAAHGYGGSQDEYDADTKIAGASVAARSAGLSSSAVDKVSSIQHGAQQKIANIDGTATKKLADIYQKAGVNSDTSSGGAGSLGIKGATKAAVASGLGGSALKQVTSLEKSTLRSIDKVDEGALDAVASVYKAEGVPFNRPGVSGRAGTSATASASAAGLKKGAVDKIASVEERATNKVEAVDRKAMNEVAAIYRKRNVPMEVPEVKEFSPRTGRSIVGATTVVGAAGAATAAGLSPSDVDKIAAIETRAVQDIDKIEDKAGDDIASVYQHEGVSFAKPGITSSRAAVAATASGLKPSSVKKAAAIEKKATDKTALADSIGMGEISAIYRQNGLKPPTPKPKPLGGNAVAAAGALTVVGAASAAAAAGLSSDDVNKIAAIEKDTCAEAESINGKASKDLKSVYKKEGVEMPEILPDMPEDGSKMPAGAVASATTAAGAAAVAGLGSGACKKVSGVEKKAADKIEKVDRNAMNEIASIYRKRGVEMEKPKPKPFSTNSGRAIAGAMTVAGATGAAAAAGLSSSDVKKIANIELQTKEEIDEIEEKAGEDIAGIYHKEGVMMEEPEVGSSMFAGAAGAAGLDPTSQKKIATIEQRSTDRIESVDHNAVSKISGVYQENGLKMKKSAPTKTKLGLMTAALGVTGATAAAAKSGIGSDGLARVSEIERESTREMEGIDKEAGENIAALYEKEGMWFDRPGASRAAATATKAGLGFAAVKRIEATEEAAERQIDNLDNKAANDIIEADKGHAIAMHKLNKQGMTASFIAKEEKAAAQKYGAIKDKVSARIAKVDERAEDQVDAVYKDEGAKMKAPRGYFTERAADGPVATTAAIKAATEAASNRKKMFANIKSRSAQKGEEDTFTTISSGAHFAVYDVGHTIAKAGNAITGVDFEGPPEYDARADHTPEQRARGCCACTS